MKRHDFVQVAALYSGDDSFDDSLLVAELIESESVPYLLALRFSESGLPQRHLRAAARFAGRAPGAIRQLPRCDARRRRHAGRHLGGLRQSAAG